MFDLIRKIIQTKTVTKTRIFDVAPARFRGKPVFTSNDCSGCGSCVTLCPANALEMHKTEESITLTLSYETCIFCGICAEECETEAIQATNEYRMASKEKESLTMTAKFPVTAPELLPTGKGG